MARPKYKSYYTIEIKKESIETVPGGIITNQSIEDESVLVYTQEPDKKEAVIRVIYTQTLEKINLQKVIEAVNA